MVLPGATATATSTRRASDNQQQTQEHTKDRDGSLKRLDSSPEDDEEHYVRWAENSGFQATFS